MNRYFNFKIGDPEQNGHVIVVNPSAPLEKRLTDYNVSNNTEEHQLGIKLTRRPIDRRGALYQVSVPEMQFSAGAHVPALAVDCGPGWDRKSQDTISLVLDDDNTLTAYRPRSRKGEQVYVSEVKKSKAKKQNMMHFFGICNYYG